MLCLSISLSLCSTAFASESKTLLESSSNDAILLSDGASLIAEDLPNGDARFTIVRDGAIIAESYLERSKGLVTNSDSRSINTTTVVSLPKNSNENVRSSDITSGYVYCGQITYNFYGNLSYVVGTRSLNVYYDRNYYTGSRYNVNGVYQNIAGFASFIAAILTLPASIAASAAASILGNLSIATGGISLLIPDCYVRCDETEITWMGQMTDFTDVYATFTGSRFVLTQEGYDSDVYYSGDYWGLSSFYNHDTDFAIKVYFAVLGQDILEVVGWNEA